VGLTAPSTVPIPPYVITATRGPPGPPPPFGRHGRAAQRADQWGPGTRIPALLVSKRFDGSGVAHEDFDTTSILKLIERRFDLQPLVTRKSRNLAVALEAANGHDRDRDRDHDDRDDDGHDDHGHHRGAGRAREPDHAH